MEQIDGLPDRYHATLPRRSGQTPSVTLSSMRFLPRRRHDPPRWQSSVLRDPFRLIQMPPFESFHDTESYYATFGP
ncbi:MAG: hypothetical protein R3F44_09020 [Candidatus Competibacteraceae bacterium]